MGNARAGRALGHGFAGAFALQYVAYAQNALLWALLLAAPLTPLFDLAQDLKQEPQPCALPSQPQLQS